MSPRFIKSIIELRCATRALWGLSGLKINYSSKRFHTK